MYKFLCLIASLVLVQQAPADWTRIQQGPFTAFTHGDPAKARALLTQFQQLEDSLAAGSGFHFDRAAGLKIISFASEAEFVPYRLNEGSCAFYQQTGHGEYVVLQPAEGPNRIVSFHEFTHFVLAHSNVKLPLWLNEGLADYYSTFQVSKEGVTFGIPVPGRLAMLRDSGLLPLAVLFQVDTASSYYSNAERMALFYSESWALAHMLVASAAYAPRFENFLQSINAGRTASDSLQAVYGKSPAQVQQDLQAYIQNSKLPLVQKTVASWSAAAVPAVASISDTEVDVQLAELSLTNPNTRAALQARLAVASQESGPAAGIEESLGYAALQQGKTDEARKHFRTAVERRSTDANVLFYLAHLDREAGEPAAKVMPLLEQAVAMKPDLGDARLELALLATEEGDYGKALQALHGMAAPRNENAYTAAYTEAYCLAYTGKFGEARASLQRAKGLAASKHDLAEVSELFEYIDQQ